MNGLTIAVMLSSARPVEPARGRGGATGPDAGGTRAPGLRGAARRGGRPDGCSPTDLMTSFTVDDGLHPVLVLPVVQAWNCSTRGGAVEYLKAP